MAKPSVFVDSSVFIAALLSSSGGSFYILTNFSSEAEFKISRYVLEEIEDVLLNKFAGKRDLYNTLFILLGIAKVEILANPVKSSLAEYRKIISKKDAPILASATECDYLITLDNEFLNAKVTGFAAEKNLKILKPKDFIEIMR